MKFLVDTNTWILYLKQVGSPVEKRLRQTPASEIAVCSVVWAELLHGARKYERRQDRVDRVTRALVPFQSLSFDDAAAKEYALIRDELERRGELIGPYDLLIASIALARNLTVVSSDVGFLRVHRLAVEDWTV